MYLRVNKVIMIFIQMCPNFKLAQFLNNSNHNKIILTLFYLAIIFWFIIFHYLQLICYSNNLKFNKYFLIKRNNLKK